MGEIKGGFTRHCRVKDKSTHVISKHLKLIYLKFKYQGSELLYSYKIAYYDMVSKGTDSFFLTIQEMQSVLFSVAQNLLSDLYKLIWKKKSGLWKFWFPHWDGWHFSPLFDGFLHQFAWFCECILLIGCTHILYITIIYHCIILLSKQCSICK